MGELGDKVNIRSVLILFLFLALTTISRAEQRIVSVSPSGPLIEQLRYLDDTWPDQHAVALVVASASPSVVAQARSAVQEVWQ